MIRLICSRLVAEKEGGGTSGHMRTSGSLSRRISPCCPRTPLCNQSDAGSIHRELYVMYCVLHQAALRTSNGDVAFEEVRQSCSEA